MTYDKLTRVLLIWTDLYKFPHYLDVHMTQFLAVCGYLISVLLPGPGRLHCSPCLCLFVPVVDGHWAAGTTSTVASSSQHSSLHGHCPQHPAVWPVVTHCPVLSCEMPRSKGKHNKVQVISCASINLHPTQSINSILWLKLLYNMDWLQNVSGWILLLFSVSVVIWVICCNNWVHTSLPWYFKCRF